MRLKKYLIVVGVLIVAGLGWLYWTHSQPVARYVFDFEARVEGESVAIHSVVGCYRFDLGYGTFPRTATHYAIKEHAFATRLKSGLIFYVAVPDVCSYVQNSDGAYLSHSNQARPSIVTPRPVVPLTYIADGREEPEVVWLLTSLDSPSSTAEHRILRSTVRQLDEEADKDLAERASDRPDPFAPSRGTTHGWLGVVFLPVSDAPELEPTWIEDRWQTGGCEIIRLNDQGQDAISGLDPYDAQLERLWTRLWNNIALSDALPDDDEEAARHALGALIPASPIREGFEIRPDRAGMVALFRADSARRPASLRASSYFFNGIPLSTDGSSNAALPFVIRCSAQNAFYVPATLNFIRMSPQ